MITLRELDYKEFQGKEYRRNSMNSEELWVEFCTKKNIDIDTPYEAWAFGGAPDKLADLVVNGVKFGTASAYDLYAAEEALDEIPKVGDYSVILNSNDEAVCVIRDYDVYIRRFASVSPFHAYSEGEEDRSLMAWRKIHVDFFTEEYKEINGVLTDDSLIVCEKFTVEYVPENNNRVVDCSFAEDELIYVEPTIEYAKEIEEYRREMLEADSSFDGCFSMKRMPDVNEYVEHCINWGDPSREPDEHGAWGIVLLCIRKSDNRMVGCMQVHYVLTERMKKYTGHAGYSVRPSERRKGYATKMLARAKDFLSTLGFAEIGVSCLVDNEASRKTILANEGEYLETVFLSDDEVYLEKYKIILK